MKLSCIMNADVVFKNYFLMGTLMWWLFISASLVTKYFRFIQERIGLARDTQNCQGQCNLTAKFPRRD